MISVENEWEQAAMKMQLLQKLRRHNSRLTETMVNPVDQKRERNLEKMNLGRIEFIGGFQVFADGLSF